MLPAPCSSDTGAVSSPLSEFTHAGASTVNSPSHTAIFSTSVVRCELSEASLDVHRQSNSQFRPYQVAVDSVVDIAAMFRYQLQMERGLHLPPAENIERTDGRVRMVVVSWMVEVTEEFSLQQETLHLAVTLLDHFLARSEEVPHCVLQLLAVGCVLLAAKELEVSQPSVEQMCDVTANHYQPPDLLRMERIILSVLDFRLSAPSSYTFLHLLAQACSRSVSPSVLSLAMYLCELAVLDADMLIFSHSTKAAAAILLAHLTVGDPQHTLNMRSAIMSCMGVATLQGLGPCMAVLLCLQQNAYQHTNAPSSATVGQGLSDAALLSEEACSAHTECFDWEQDQTCSPPEQQLSLEQQAQQVPSSRCGYPQDLLAPVWNKFSAPDWCQVAQMQPLHLLPLHL